MKALNIFVSIVCISLLTTGAWAGDRLLTVKILERQSEPNAGIVFSNLTFSEGLPPVERLKKKEQEAPYEFQVLNSAGSVIYTKKFDFNRHLEVPLPEPGSQQLEGGSRVLLKEPEAVLVVPYLPEGLEVRVKGPKETTPPTPLPVIPESYQVGSLSPSPAPAQEGNLYILMIASGFSKMSDFQTKAQETKTYLANTEPFSFAGSNLNISIYENRADLGCYSGCYNIDRLICCDSEKVIASAVASGQLYDEIIVIHNTTTYSGGGIRDLGSYQTNTASSYCVVYNGDYAPAMTLHEFGHSFGNLCDEYTYGSEEYLYDDCANCRASCSDWSNVSTVCQLGCDARSDYYRPEDSIMLSTNITSYNQPSIHNSLVPRLKFFIPTFSLSETPPSETPQSETFVPVPILELLLEQKE